MGEGWKCLVKRGQIGEDRASRGEAGTRRRASTPGTASCRGGVPGASRLRRGITVAVGSFFGVFFCQVVVLSPVAGEVVELPLVAIGDIGRSVRLESPRRTRSAWCWRSSRRGRWRGCPAFRNTGSCWREAIPHIGFVPSVSHAGPVHGVLSDAVDHGGCRNPGRFQDRGRDVYDMMELVTNAARVLDAFGPGDAYPLFCAAEMGGDLLGPLERGVEHPGPTHGHVVCRSCQCPRRRRTL